MWVIDQNKMEAHDLSDCKSICVVDCFEVSAYFGDEINGKLNENNLILLGVYDPCGRAMEVLAELAAYLSSGSKRAFHMPER